MSTLKSEEKKKRAEQITDMVLTGYSYENIAHKLGVSRRTIIRDVQENRKQIIKEMSMPVEEQIAQLEAAKNRRIKHLWTTVLDPKSSRGDKHKAIQLLQNEEQLEIKRKQLIGYLPPEAPSVAIQNTNVIEGVTTIADSIRRNYPELINRFKKKGEIIDAKAKEDTKSD